MASTWPLQRCIPSVCGCLDPGSCIQRRRCTVVGELLAGRDVWFGLVWCFSGAHTHQALGATAVDITQAPPPKIGFESNQGGPSSSLNSPPILTSPCPQSTGIFWLNPARTAQWTDVAFYTVSVTNTSKISGNTCQA